MLLCPTLVSTERFTSLGKLGWPKGLVRRWGCQGLAVAGSGARSSGQRWPGCLWFAPRLVTGRWRWWLLSWLALVWAPCLGPCSSVCASCCARAFTACGVAAPAEGPACKEQHQDACLQAQEAQCEALPGLVPQPGPAPMPPQQRLPRLLRRGLSQHESFAVQRRPLIHCGNPETSSPTVLQQKYILSFKIHKPRAMERVLDGLNCCVTAARATVN